jgi:hypothetical protein
MRSLFFALAAAALPFGMLKGQALPQPDAAPILSVGRDSVPSMTAAPAADPVGMDLFSQDPVSVLGYSVRELIEGFGPPEKLWPFRGTEPWQDDVVLAYPGGLSFFVWGDRVWQLRLEKDSPLSMLGIKPGMAAEAAIGVLGEPRRAEGPSLGWELGGRAFPVWIRAIVTEGSIVDLYLYRADF